ncbi:MAG: ABC transporter permease subunit [Bacillaceae bacterium]
MNIYRRELKANRKALLFWCLGVIFLVAVGMIEYKGTSASNGSMNAIMDKMPAVFKAFFGVGSLDASTISGYYGMIYFYILIMAAIYGAMLGGMILTKERRDKTAEFLFVKPVTRGKVITAKLLAGTTNVIIFNLVSLLVSVGIVDYLNEGKSITKEIFLLTIGMFFVQMVFFALGFMLSTLTTRSKLGILSATNIVFMTFLLSVFIDINDKLDMLQVLTPFQYFKADAILTGENLSITYMILCFVLIVGCCFGSYRFFRNRDVV